MLKLMAANWKMYKTPTQAIDTAKELLARLNEAPMLDREVVVFPSATNISSLNVAKATMPPQFPFGFGAQNFYPADEGAYTGEISLDMIKPIGAEWVLVGHSERRSYFGETDAFLADKTEFALTKGMRVVFCIGETLEEREGGKLQSVLKTQLVEGLAKLPADYKAEDLAIAYEPVWAIGTGKVASEKDIEEAHAIVRALLIEILAEKANETRILYGGSVKPENAVAIMAIANVDGVLVGGASLQAESFSSIVRS